MGQWRTKWEKIHSSLITTSDEVLGLANSRQPDGFKESESELRPYLIAKMMPGPALKIGKLGSCLGPPSKRAPQDSITAKHLILS